MQLGATPLVARGDGDDQHYLGVDGALDPWLEGWWKAVLSLYPIPKGLEITPATSLPQNTFDATLLESVNGDSDNTTSSYSMLGSFDAIVRSNERITDPNHFQDVRHFEFTLNAPDTSKAEEPPRYEPGDVFIIYPKNRPEKVQKVIDFLGWKDYADKLYQFTVNKSFQGNLFAFPVI